MSNIEKLWTNLKATSYSYGTCPQVVNLNAEISEHLKC
jgi:hypothetical protein